VPELLRRWENRCFCRNGQFLKLISFNFENYGRSPMALMDTELVIVSLVIGRFERVQDWDAGGERADRCPKCGEVFLTRYEQYSINMERQTSRPRNALPMAAAIGQYCVGFSYFAHSEHGLKKITDYRLVSSVEAFIDGITNAT
jgi:hypothetical protein